MAYNNGGDDGTMMIMMVMVSFLLCCCCACMSSILTAYANDGCDTSGTFSFLIGDWYRNLVGSFKLFQDCGVAASPDPPAGNTTTTTSTTTVDATGASSSTGGGSGGGSGGNASTTGGGGGGKNVKLPKGKKCNVGTVANYDYTVRTYNESKKAWECPSGWTTTWCGVATDSNGNWVDGDKSSMQCRKRKSPSSGGSNNNGGSSGGSSSANGITIVDDPHKKGSSEQLWLGLGDYPTLSEKVNVKTKGYNTGTRITKSWDDKIAAFNIPAGITVDAYEHPNYGGDSVRYVGTDTKNVYGIWSHWVDGQWNSGKNRWDSISSLKVWKSNSGGSSSNSGGTKCNYNKKSDKVWVFEKENYKGNCQSFGSGNHNLDWDFLNNSVGSIKVPGKRKVKLCKDAGLGGQCKVFTKDKSNMYSSHKSARSISVYK